MKGNIMIGLENQAKNVRVSAFTNGESINSL